MNCQNGGQIKELVSASKHIIKTSGNIANDLAKSLSNVIGGLTNGLEIITKTAGNTLNNLSKKLEITSVKTFKRVGHVGLKVSKELGDVVQVIPILGKPAAYVVKGSGRGVYYVVASVGHVIGKSIRTVGRVTKETSDLVVFTITSSSSATEKALKKSGKIIKNVTKMVNGKKKTKKSKKGKKKRSKTQKKR